MKCEKCNKEHDGTFGSGRFCSRFCANSRTSNRKEINKKISKSMKGQRSWRKGMIFNYERNMDYYCLSCGKKLSGKTKTLKCKNCWNENTDKMRAYRYECSFKFNVFDYPEKFPLELIKEKGFYSPKNRKNNLKGVSRDHLISVKYGFENNINSKIISHPANCQIVLNEENNKKNTKCDITLNELKLKIKKWNKNTHDTVAELV